MAKTKKEPKKVPSLKRVLAQINKEYGDNVIGTLADMQSLNIERLKTGIQPLDDALGGGFPLKRVVELYGLPSGGKSLISLLAIKAAQEQGLECVYVDAEDSFDPIWAAQVGVDVDKLVVTQVSVVEDVMDMVCNLLESEPGVIVVDSVASMIPRAELEESVDKVTMALKARLMSRAVNKITPLNKKTLVILINQIRATMAMFGAQTTTPGGNAIKHGASIRMEVKKGETLHVDDKKRKPVIGQVVNFRVVKNKTAAPYQTGSFKLYHKDARIELE